MKKAFTILLTILLVCTLCLSAHAHTNSPFVYEYDNKTIIFEGNTLFDATQRQNIISVLLNGDDGIAPCGLACLFGHNYEIEYVTTITHCASDTQPRCLEEVFEIEACTRCDKANVTQIASYYITCCD